MYANRPDNTIPVAMLGTKSLENSRRFTPESRPTWAFLELTIANIIILLYNLIVNVLKLTKSASAHVAQESNNAVMEYEPGKI